MSGSTPDVPARPKADLPARPQYGEYATPEQQRAAIRQPHASWALETGQSPGADPVRVHVAEPPAEAHITPTQPARRADRPVTFGLLALGAVNVVATSISYFDLAGLADQAMKLLGVPGEFTNVEGAQLWGPIAAAVLIAGFVLTALLTWRNLRAGRLSWWIPLVGAIVTYLVVYVCLAIPLLGDPAFIAYSTSLS